MCFHCPETPSLGCIDKAESGLSHIVVLKLRERSSWNEISILECEQSDGQTKEKYAIDGQLVLSFILFSAIECGLNSKIAHLLVIQVAVPVLVILLDQFLQQIGKRAEDFPDTHIVAV